MRQRRGLDRPFNVAAWEKNVLAKANATLERKRQRKAARRAADWDVSDSEMDDAIDALTDDSDSTQAEEVQVYFEDLPTPASKINMFKRAAPRKLSALVENNSSEEESPPVKHRKTRESHDIAEKASLIDDSLVGELKQRVQKKSRNHDLTSMSSSKASQKQKTVETAREPERKRLTKPQRVESPIHEHSPSSSEAGSKRGELPSRTGYAGTANQGGASRKNTTTGTKAGTATRTTPAPRVFNTGPRRSSSSIGFGSVYTGLKAGKRRKIDKTLMENGEREPEHYGKLSVLRKVELASRNMPDRESHAPGPLMAPSEYANRPLPTTRGPSFESQDNSETLAHDTESLPRRRAVRFADDEDGISLSEQLQTESASTDASRAAESLITTTNTNSTTSGVNDVNDVPTGPSRKNGRICYYFTTSA